MKLHVLIITIILCVSVFIPLSYSDEGITDDNDQQFCKAKYPFCKGGAPIHKVNEDDVLDVTYLEAPVFEELVGPITGLFKMLHTGIGFHDRNTGEEFTLEYDAKFEVANATFPFVIGKKLKWCNAGAYCSYRYIKKDYWTFNQTLVAHINGQQFNNLVDWVTSINRTSSYAHYELWDVYDLPHWKNPPDNEKHHLISALHCASGAFKILGKLKAFGAKMLVNALHRDYIVLYADDLKEVNQNDPSTRSELLNYYKDFNIIGKTFHEIVHLIEKFLLHEKFIYSNGKYYKMTMRWPFFGFHYAATPILPIDY
eukprot:gb/GECH01005277.1/.p1 GENE.gb/GECH01005277.1/~~gb/GECH01005277.1/.p1  ORF type:complete len:312 (+),score=74.69 gb/GECH01005277.1/:1-936(+)